MIKPWNFDWPKNQTLDLRLGSYYFHSPT